MINTQLIQKAKDKKITETQRIQSIRNWKQQNKKKIQKNISTMEISDSIQSLIFDGKQDEAINMFSVLEQQILIKVIFGKNSFGTTLLLDSVEGQYQKLLKYFNTKLGLNNKLVSTYFQTDKKYHSALVVQFIRIIVKKWNLQMKDFLMKIIEEIGKPKSFLYNMFECCQWFVIQPQLVSSKELSYLGKYFQKLFQSLELNELNKYIQIFIQKQKGIQAWNKNIFNCQDNQNIFVLQNLSYNVLHKFANEQNQKDFFDFMQVSNTQLINQLNISQKTPIDIALKRFTIFGVERVLQKVQKQQSIKLSTSSINMLLLNKNILNNVNSLSQFITKIKIILQRGYLKIENMNKGNKKRKQQKRASITKNAEHLLQKINSQGYYSLLYYIFVSKNPSQQIVNKLIFSGLKQFGKNQNKNIIIKNIVLQRANCILRSSKYELNQISKQLIQNYSEDKFCIGQLFQSLVRLKNQNLFNILLQYFYFSNVQQKKDLAYLFLRNSGKGCQLNQHILVSLIKDEIFQERILQLINIIFDQSNQNLQPPKFNFQKTTNQQVYKFNQIYSQNINIANQIIYSLQVINLDSRNYITELKSKIKKYYNQNPQLYFSFIIRNSRLTYIINFVDFFLSQTQIQYVIKTYCPQYICQSLMVDCLERNPKIFQIIRLHQGPNKNFDDFLIKIINNNKKHSIEKIITLLNNLDNSTFNFQPYQYYCRIVRKCKLISQFIKKLMDQQNLKILIKLMNTSIIQNEILSFATFNVFKYSRQLINNLLKQTNTIFQWKKSYKIQVLNLTNPLTFINHVVDLGQMGIDTQLQFINKEQILKQLQNNDIEVFQKSVIRSMVTNEESYFKSLLRSDFKYYDKIKMFMQNRLCLFRLFQIKQFQCVFRIKNFQKYYKCKRANSCLMQIPQFHRYNRQLRQKRQYSQRKIQQIPRYKLSELVKGWKVKYS